MATTWKVAVAVAVRAPLVAVTVKVELPGVVGVPVMAPVARLRTKPAGSVPVVTA